MNEITRHALWALVAVVGATGWVMHILSTENIEFLVFGAVVFPVGIVNGWLTIIDWAS